MLLGVAAMRFAGYRLARIWTDLGKVRPPGDIDRPGPGRRWATSRRSSTTSCNMRSLGRDPATSCCASPRPPATPPYCTSSSRRGRRCLRVWRGLRRGQARRHPHNNRPALPPAGDAHRAGPLAERADRLEGGRSGPGITKTLTGGDLGGKWTVATYKLEDEFNKELAIENWRHPNIKTQVDDWTQRITNLFDEVKRRPGTPP